VVKGLPAEWGTCSRTVSLGDIAPSLSYHNNSVAVGSMSNDIIILDAITGNQIAVLSGHAASVDCVTFSSGGKSLVSGSSDKTVKLWDVQTGRVIKTFHGHTGWVWSVSISVDSTRIASGSEDKTVCLWDIQTGDCICTIQQQGQGRHVSFSPMDPQQLISISGKKVWWWDVNGHQILPTYDGSHIAFSPDHTKFALCNGEFVTVQNSDSREIVARLPVLSHWLHFCCFSPDGRLIAAAAGRNAYVWDITNPVPHLIGTLFGHADITSLVFSSPSSLISASDDKSVKFWKIGALPTDQVPTDPGPNPPISSVSLQTRAGIAISSDEGGVVKTWDLLTGLCKETFQIPAAKDLLWDSSDAQMINGRLIFIWHKWNKIYILDVNKNELLQTLDALSCRGLRISGDGSKIFLLDGKFIQAWAMWTWGCVQVGLQLGGAPYLDSLYTESSRVQIHYKGSSFQEGWDFGTLAPFDPSTGRPHLDFIGGTRWQTDGPSQIKDTATGKKVFQLSGRYARPNDVRWDGQYLVAGYESGEVLILDFDHMYPQ